MADGEVVQALSRTSQSIGKVSLPVICRSLADLGAYEQLADLCLLKAKRIDPKQLALMAYRHGRAGEDREVQPAEKRRAESYKCMTDVLVDLEPSSSRSSPTSSDSNDSQLESAEDRQRINVRWFVGPADVPEDKIAVYSQRLGCQMYNIISYPAGGVKRGFWKPSSESCDPPPVDLPDVQLQNHLWKTYINVQISSWTDCDSEDKRLALLSENELVKELNYLAYMGLRTVIPPEACGISTSGTNTKSVAGLKM